MIVRPATAADIPVMMALERGAATAAHWMPAEYERIFTLGQTPRVALLIHEGGEVLGFLVARALGSDWEIENVAIAAEARRRGLGLRLISEFLNVAHSRSASAVFLEVRESNIAARALYQKAAFRQVGRRQAYYNHPVEDAVVYRRDFAPA